MKDSKKMKEQKKSAAHKVGDAVERVGEKAAKMGATKTGKAIYRAGNKLEHSQDEK
jgi:hypothetical protein